MKKTKLIHSKYILLMLCFCSSVFLFGKQPTKDAFPKGKFLQTRSENKYYDKVGEVYSASASKLASDWRNKGFSLQKKSGESIYATGKYAANANLSAESPKIQLPSIAEGEKLIVELDQSYKTETRYDFISVAVTEGGQTTTVYSMSGMSSRIIDYIDLSNYAGKQIELSLLLTSDDSKQSDGWQIYNLDVYKAVETSGVIQLRSASAPQVASLQILNINADAFPDAMFVEFTAKDANGDFVSGLDASDFSIWDNSSQMYGCAKLLERNTSMQPAIDVVFLVDNSGSMSTYYNRVNSAISSFLDGLGNQFDAQVSLMRFGQSSKNHDCDYATMETDNNNQFFFSIETLADRNYFLNTIWSRNEQTGYYEPYYEVLNWAANQNLPYRDYAKKVFILIGDEMVYDGTNDESCTYATTIDQSAVAANLLSKGIQTFPIISSSVQAIYNEYTDIASQTGGVINNVNNTDYSPVLSDIAGTITGSYIYRYCVNGDENDMQPNIIRPVKVELSSNTSIFDEGGYTPMPAPHIVRTPATIALDNTVLPQTQNVTLGATVIRAGHNLDSIEFYYKQYNDANFAMVTQYPATGVITGDSISFSFTVPGAKVLDPNIAYYFRAYTSLVTGTGTQSYQISNPPNNQEYFAWTLAVDPNLPPAITDVTVSSPVRQCTPITICAKVIDNTNNLKAVPKLYYRISKTPSVFIDIDMLPCSSLGSDMYCSTIPASAVQETNIEYYISAEDDYGTQGWYGTPTKPNVLNTNASVNTSGYLFDVFISNYANVVMGCDPLVANDSVAAYFTNDCGDLQFAGGTRWNGIAGSFSVRVYGDSDPNDGYKDGFTDGETIFLKLIRGGIDYQLTNNTIPFSTSAPQYAQLSSAVGPGTSKLTLKGNGVEITNNDNTPSSSDNTDFGSVSSSVVKTYEIQNTGCTDLLLNMVSVNDNTNFTLSSIPQNQLISPNGSYSFDITYLAQADANATVTINNNSSNTNPFKFDIQGSVASPAGSCDDISISWLMNLTSAYGGVPQLTVAQNNPQVIIRIISLAGVIEQTVFDGTYAPGQYTGYVNAGLAPGYHVLSIMCNGVACGSSGVIVVQ